SRPGDRGRAGPRCGGSPGIPIRDCPDPPPRGPRESCPLLLLLGLFFLALAALLGLFSRRTLFLRLALREDFGFGRGSRRRSRCGNLLGHWRSYGDDGLARIVQDPDARR